MLESGLRRSHRHKGPGANSHKRKSDGDGAGGYAGITGTARISDRQENLNMQTALTTHYAVAAKLSLTQAIEAALREVPGTAYKAKLKEKKGFLVYKVSIVSPKDGPVEVKVDPGSGTVVEVKVKDHKEHEEEGEE